MPEPSKLSIQVTSESCGRKTVIRRLFTLDALCDWIRNLELDDYTINGLIQLASRYPDAALPSFKKNINLMIQRVRAKKQKDQQGEEIYASEPEVESPTNPENSFRQTFNTGPEKVSITEEDLHDEWETETPPEEKHSNEEEE